MKRSKNNNTIRAVIAIHLVQVPRAAREAVASHARLVQGNKVVVLVCGDSVCLTIPVCDSELVVFGNRP